MDASTPARSTEDAPARNRRRSAALVALYAVLALLLSSPVLDPADDFGDPSFQQAYAYFLAETLQAGEDYIFTYGPLGHFLIPRFQPGLFWLDHVVGFAMGIVAAWPVFVLFRRLGTFRVADRLMLIVPIMLAAQFGPGPETPYLLSAFALLVLLRKDLVRHPAAVGAFAAALAFLSLAKFTLLVLSVGFAGYLCLHYLVRRCYGLAAVISVTYPVVMLVLWSAAGQRLGNLPAFVRDSIEISSAYNAGMFLDGRLDVRVLGVVVLFSTLAASLPLLTYQKQRVPPVLDAVFIFVYLAILWKMGMVRQNAHEVKFLLPALMVTLLVPMRESGVLWFRHAAIGVSILAGVLGHAIALQTGPVALISRPVAKVGTALYQAVLPISRENALEARWHELGIWDSFRKTETVVGDRSIDMFPPEQRVLLTGEYNYSPRYVFQGYQACTPRLLALNGASYWGTRPTPPPEFVLYRSMPIDYRFPYMEDSQALLALFYCYSPVLLERGLVLFERNADAPAALPEAVPVAAGVLAPGETLGVPETRGQWQVLSLAFEEAGTGRMASLFSGGAAYVMAVEYADGRSAEYRVLPSMTTLPFLLNRFWGSETPVHQNNDYRRDQITSLRVLAPDPGDAGNWRVRYTLEAIAAPSSAGLEGGSGEKPILENEGVPSR
jgi:hypothetical protein